MIRSSAINPQSPFADIKDSMKAITVLFAGNLKSEALIPLENIGKSAFCLALEQAKQFPDTEKLVVLGYDNAKYPDCGVEFSLISSEKWTRKSMLEAISKLEFGYDIVYFAWLDCPFLDPALAAALKQRHTQYAADYSYADGFPYGFAPELLSPGVSGILFNIDNEEDVPVTRDALFQVIQKDINAFNIETEIAPVDLRLLRLCLAADSKRNLLLLNRWLKSTAQAFEDKKIPVASDAASLVEKHPQMLRTLPSFYNIQVCEACPQDCSYCPWPKIKAERKSPGNGCMDPDKFKQILDKIIEFSGDAVISLSFWGELALHPQKIELISMVLERPSLSLIIETSGIGWKQEELKTISSMVQNAAKRTGVFLDASLSWIVSLDAFDPARYKEVRGPGFSEANTCVNQLIELFSGNIYLQAIRFQGAEDDIEAFYRHWKNLLGQTNHVIIQKYDHFSGRLPRLQASDLSPVRRQPCWHIKRDMHIALDGTVLRCRTDFGSNELNVFNNSFTEIWDSTNSLYLEHCKGQYAGECADCDEYYTYNF